MNKVYEIITDRITKQLEQGNIPWRKPWKGEAHAPRNFVSKKAYRGINLFLLNADNRFTSPYWLTFKQCTDLGGKVTKGEKAAPVIFWKWLDVDEKDESGTKAGRVPMLRYYSVFNVEQCTGLTLPVKAPETLLDFNPIEAAEAIVKGYSTAPEIKETEKARAYYSPGLDYINMPVRSTFHSVEEFYSTLFHELTHSTGHEKRLKREGIIGMHFFGDAVYSREELVAEFGAAFLCGHAGIENVTLDNSAAYIQSWLKVLKNNKQWLVIAAAQAQKAAEYILGIKHEKDAA